MSRAPHIPAGVAAGNPETAGAGRDVLLAGGTAADAAVAATLAAAVAEGMMTGLGGGGFATYFDAATHEVTCADFFVAVPGLGGGHHPGAMRPLDIDFGGIPMRFAAGGASVAVPGTVAGCQHVHERFGRLPWDTVVAPAYALASNGLAMTDMGARVLAAIEPAMVAGAGAKVWAPDGRLLRAGEVLRQPDLARTLALVADRGAAAFVDGPLAEALVEAVVADGGAVDPVDLRAYDVLPVPTVTCHLGGATVAGRRDLLDTIGTLARLPDDLATRAAGARAVALADALAAQPPEPPERIGETTNVTAVDGDGNACVITTSLGVGAGVWVEGYGVHLNSMLGEAELHVGDLHPGERMSSMMTPLVAFDSTTRDPRHGGGLAVAAGAAGASRIRTALLFVMTGALLDGHDLGDVIAGPRLHVAEGAVQLEPGFPDTVPDALEAAGYRVRQWPARDHYFGGASAIGRTGAGADPRRGGAVALC